MAALLSFGLSTPNNNNDLAFPTPLNGTVARQRLSAEAFPSTEGDPPPQRKAPPRSGGTEGGAGNIHHNEDAHNFYQRPARAASNRSIGDKYVDMENRARKRDRGTGGLCLPERRVRDLTRFFAFTYGGLPDDDAGRDLFFVLAHHVTSLDGDPENSIRDYAAAWCKWMPDDELDALARRVLAKPYKWGADVLAHEIGLYDAVRTLLDIRSIGAIDVPKAERVKRRAQRKAETKKAKRRAAGSKPQAASLSSTKPWLAGGMSRAKFYRLGLHRETSETVLTPHILTTLYRGQSCLTPETPPSAAPPQPMRAGMMLGFPSTSDRAMSSDRSKAYHQETWVLTGHSFHGGRKAEPPQMGAEQVEGRA